MECNKDDANRAKEIAERKLTEKDFAGAKKFAMKAQALYPGIDGLSQLMTTIDVHVSGEKKVNGEVDWYGILGITPSADDDVLKKQYRKLALMLHPDKNKGVGAEGAFKLLSEAWSVLSDKSKRLAYNQRRSLDKSRNIAANKSSSNVPQPHPTSAPRPPGQKSNSFWTSCGTCKMHYEYLRIYLNNTILCSKCRKPFKAIETAPPSKYAKQPNSTSHQKPQKPAPPASNFPMPPVFPDRSNHKPPQQANVRNPAPVPNTKFGAPAGSKFQQGRTGSMGPTDSSSVGAKAAYVIHQANERMKRAREEALGVGGLEKKRSLDGNFNGYVGKRAPQTATGYNVFDFAGVKLANMSTRELTPLETQNMLMKRAKSEIVKKLSEMNLETSTKAAESKKVNSSNGKQKSSVKPDKSKQNKNGVANGNIGGEQAKKSSIKTSIEADKKEDVEINVPDPDFYDFDQDRMESSFEENQVWAAYDDDDGMPRFYAIVHKVASLKPFKMRISWLESRTNTEFSDMKWVGCGFYKCCGEYEVGKPEFTKSLNSFSHKAKWVKSPTGSICILPKKGDVWALYRNWSRDWNELIPDEVIHKYDLYEILEDYNEDQGVSIAPLVKVPGFRTVFCARTDPEHVLTIPKEEMLRFSHQIPNHLLTGEEAKNAPKGLQELDPASTPLEFIQLVTEANEKNMDGYEKIKDEHMTDVMTSTN